MFIQLVKKFPAFCGTRTFITVFTWAHHWFLSWASCILSTQAHSNFKVVIIIIIIIIIDVVGGLVVSEVTSMEGERITNVV